MKILVISQRYWPESFRITDIAEELASRGHDVTVLTGLPNYPQGYLYDGYKHGGNRLQERNGVKIVRVKEIERRHGIVRRFLNYYSFAHYAKKAVKGLDDDYDAILVNGISPIMSAEPAVVYKKKHKNVKVVMYEMDLWPESLLAGGIKKGSIIYRHYEKVSAKIYSSFDKIMVTTKDHSGYIKGLKGCSALDIEWLPQYAEGLFDDVKRISKSESGPFDILFAGNIGEAQAMPVIMEAALALKDSERYRFHIVGSGSELKNSVSFAKKNGLANVTFYGQRPVEDMPGFYERCDIGLVTLSEDSYARMTIPGKTQSYMAAGLAVVSSAPGATDGFIEESGCGIAAKEHSGTSLAEAISSLTIGNIKRLGEAGRTYYRKNLRKDIFIDRIEKELSRGGMMTDCVLEARKVSKKYPKFQLKDFSFSVPKGAIVGFIGRNGAGKTTMLKGIMNLIRFDGGSVFFMGNDMKTHEMEAKEQIGFTLSELTYYPNKTIKQIVDVTSRFYPSFSKEKFERLCSLFSLDVTKRLQDLSSGMKVKYSLAVALSHEAKLLILDEPTSGLDPISRDEILDIFKSIVKDGERSIIFSTHITSDLDKCASHILYIKGGEKQYEGTKENFVNGYTLISGPSSLFSGTVEELALAHKEDGEAFTALIHKEDEGKMPKGITLNAPDLETIMVYLERGKQHEEFAL